MKVCIWDIQFLLNLQSKIYPLLACTSIDAIDCRWLQDVFNAPLLIMLTDDMKMLHTTGSDVDVVQRYTSANGSDILAFGFQAARTFLFSNLDFVGGPFYENIVRVARMISVASIKRALGFNDENNVGMFYCCSTQSAGTFATSFPVILSASRPGWNSGRLNEMHCLVACSWDTDGYFTEVRKHAESLGSQRPAFIYSSLLPGLQGADSKMSASVKFSSIYLTDEPMLVKAKIEHAFAEGKLDDLTMFAYLKAFLEDDDALERLHKGLEEGNVQLAELKEVLIQTVQEATALFQKRRTDITGDQKRRVMEKRCLFH